MGVIDGWWLVKFYVTGEHDTDLFITIAVAHDCWVGHLLLILKALLIHVVDILFELFVSDMVHLCIGLDIFLLSAAGAFLNQLIIRELAVNDTQTHVLVV